MTTTTQSMTAMVEQAAVRTARPRLLTRPLLRVLLIDVCALTSLYLLLSVTPMYAAAQGTAGAGAVTAALMWSTLVAELATPLLVVRYGYRMVLTTGVLLLGVPALVLVGMANLSAIFVVCMVRGIGFGVVTVAAGALTASLLPPERRGEGLGLLGAAVGLPGVVGLPAGVWLAGHFGFSAVFLVAAASALAGLAAVPGLPQRAPHPSHRTSVLAGLRSPALAGPSVVFAATTCAAGIIVAFLPLAVGHRSGSLATLGLFAQAAAATITRWWAGRRSDRRGPASLLLPGLIAAAAGMLLLVLFANAAVLIGAMVLFGAGFGVTQNATLALMLDRAEPSAYGAVNAVWNFAYDGGWGVGAAAFGLMVGHSGYPVGFALTAVLMLTAMPAARHAHRRANPRTSTPGTRTR